MQPLINRIEDHLLESPYLHMDETPVQVLNEAGKSAQSTSYMWVRSAGPPGSRLILFDYDRSRSRSGSVAQRLLLDYQGAIMVEGYERYSAVCKEQTIVRLGCWVHARWKFAEARKISKKGKQSKADYALKLIAKLYAVEKRLRNDSPGIRYEARLKQSKLAIDKLKVWLVDRLPIVAPKTTLGTALSYLDHQWSRLVAYLDDGCYPIDNNPIENAIRPFALGRKN